ncbi:SGNH/GDSL hydrolase family protein [Argonema galeatum]|uniref:SGNH/GDSL hydrolase family protein n=1 Tax=Argonema galeatum TaxID=2942762 RepID=UPI00201148A8|nr:SGNH/GDSL hydrolase family protein [Argonema galeatum]MCL1468525.1 SGNH/GDSL hydrolase family protein [Argonema galeatum A003/A1]
MRIPAKYWIPGSVVGVLIATEVILRLAFGLGNPVLSEADRYTGYRFQPNQKLFRFGKHIAYNQYSQRSEPITPKKTPGKLRILMTGDSVLNGGNPTDQSQTITELFEAKLSASGHPAEVLNASAGSWGIGNALGYLREFGTFNANAVILQIGTHDLTQPTSTSDVVGHHPSYPTHPPLLAIQEAWTRYTWPNLAVRLGLNATSSDLPPPTSSNPNGQFKQNMESLKQIVKLVRAQKIPVFVLYTPSFDDLLPKPRQPKYKSEFLRLLKSLQVPIIDTHTAWSTLPPKTVETYFRDWVHLTEPGNQAIAHKLFDRLCVARQLPVCLPKNSAPKPTSP